jgi:hypothetical protein
MYFGIYAAVNEGIILSFLVPLSFFFAYVVTAMSLFCSLNIVYISS